MSQNEQRYTAESRCLSGQPAPVWDRRLAPNRRSDQGDRRWHDTFTARQHAEEGLREGPQDRRKYGPCRRETVEESV